MSRATASAGFSSLHVERLREKLIEWGNPTNADENSGGFIDIWFVDSDVLSTYINLSPGNYLSHWPSLYALDGEKDVPETEAYISEDARALADTIAIAVSYFLFGRFRETLSVQSRRFLLTPEHDRELDAMAIAVSFETQHNAPGWMSALTAQYMALTKSEGATDHIDKIFDLLKEGSPSGKVSRTLDLRRRLLDTMQDTAFFPTDEPGSAFAFQTRGNAFQSRVTELAKEAFGVFLEVTKANPSTERYAPIQKMVFDFHSPGRRLREYVDHVSLKSIEILNRDRDLVLGWPSELDEYALIKQAKRAALQVSDVYALARLVTLAEFLNTHHRQETRQWRVNLMTGSHMQRTLYENWRQRNAAVGGVRLVHPLSAMGIDGFAQPDEGLSDQDSDDHRDSAGAYALRALRQESPGNIDVDEFLRDFKRLLSAVAVSCAPHRERWMRGVRMKLANLEQHSRGLYLKTVRDAISRDFVSTFALLNQISPTTKGKLPTVSLPALALPLALCDPSPAQEFVMRLHGESAPTKTLLSRLRRSPPNQPSIPPVFELIKADPTGYSALLCVGLGYLAQGQAWLRLAEAVVNTAVTFASTPVSEACEDEVYPHGNEALYFAAFISRMQVDGSAATRGHARDWLKCHVALVGRALTILDDWGRTEIGQRPVAEPKTGESCGMTLAELVRIRYEAERLAGDVFGHLIDRFERSAIKLMAKSPIECLDAAKGLAGRWSELSAPKLQAQYRADVAFVGAQLAASIIQAWLCVLADEPKAKQSNCRETHEKWITDWLRVQEKNNPGPGSLLVQVLKAIYVSRTQKSPQADPKLREASQKLSQMQFAALDKFRKPLFERLLTDTETPVSHLFCH